MLMAWQTRCAQSVEHHLRSRFPWLSCLLVLSGGPGAVWRRRRARADPGSRAGTRARAGTAAAAERGDAMKCQQCGSDNPGDAAFCENCGAKQVDLDATRYLCAAVQLDPALNDS